MIGQLYIKEKRYTEGLKTWNSLIESFPNTKEALFVAGRMKKTFIKLFDEGIAYDLPPFEALALYFEFRELTPVGEKGDKIIQQLADHFISADLLDNATALIEHQIKFRVTGEERDLLAIKLADLHLQNRRPDRVPAILNFIDQENATDKVKADAKYLLVRSYKDFNKYYKATAELEDDFGQRAQDLRLDMFWKRKNWFGIINIVESRLDRMKQNAPTMLTKKEVSNLTRLSIAYASQAQRKKLRQLQTDFVNRIENEKYRNVFGFVTNDIPHVNHTNFKETVQLEEMETFMNDYIFWPEKEWANVSKVLSEQVKLFQGTPTIDLTKKQKTDVLRLGISYAMQTNNADAGRILEVLGRNFRDIIIDKDNLEIMSILDHEYLKIKDDAVFEGKISLAQLKLFVEQYQSAEAISDLNAAVLQ